MSANNLLGKYPHARLTVLSHEHNPTARLTRPLILTLLCVYRECQCHVADWN